MNKKILEKITKRFTYQPQNWEELVSLWEADEPISFYSWECPPRKIVIDEKNGRWVNFDIDIASIVKGKKLDEFTELPRLTSQWQQEKWFIQSIVNRNPKATYTKIVADTNALYLYTKSLEILGNEKVAFLSKKFQQCLGQESQKLLGKNAPKIVLYTDLQCMYRKEYELFFDFVYSSFEATEKIISNEIESYWMDRMINHVGLIESDKKERIDIMQRVIASYAAEGMVFTLLNRGKELINPVWVNWEEKPDSTQTTEILRKRYGLDPIPVIYFV